jgi:hypothetical protein
MSSTYSPSLRIQLVETGTEFEAWGEPTNNNLGTIIEQAITGVGTVSITNLTSYTLTTANAAVDEARNAVLVFTGNLNANCNVIAPSVEKVYIVSNQTTNNKAVTIKTSGGNGVTLANGTNQLIYCNGTDFNPAIDVNNIIGNLTVSGSQTLGGNLSAQSIVLNGSLTTNTGNLTFTSPANFVTMAQTTGAFVVPSGSTAQRPPSPVLGMARWNTSLGWYEIWNGTIWQQITGSFNVDYLLVGGGGGGGWGSFSAAGGGGAGGFLTGAATLAPNTNYTITVGTGGTGGTGLNATNGGSSSAFSVTALGGGHGGYGPNYTVGSGGSGGGGANNEQLGSGTTGQGSPGGPGRGDPFRGGGGGGAAAAGGNGNSGIGGIGIQSSITGTAVYYAGGGGGGGCNAGGGQDATLPGAGGLGGGGLGGFGGPDGSGPVPTAGVAGTANTGGGGGGGARVGQYGVTSGGNGGSGVVIVSYAYPAQRAVGGTVTSYVFEGTTYWVHRFTTSGTFAT